MTSRWGWARIGVALAAMAGAVVARSSADAQTVEPVGTVLGSTTLSSDASSVDLGFTGDGLLVAVAVESVVGGVGSLVAYEETLPGVWATGTVVDAATRSTSVAATPGGGIAIARVAANGDLFVAEGADVSSLGSWMSIGRFVDSVDVATLPDGRLVVAAITRSDRLLVAIRRPDLSWGPWTQIGIHVADVGIAPREVRGDLRVVAATNAGRILYQERVGGVYGGWEEFGRNTRRVDAMTHSSLGPRVGAVTKGGNRLVSSYRWFFNPVNRWSTYFNSPSDTADISVAESREGSAQAYVDDSGELEIVRDHLEFRFDVTGFAADAHPNNDSDCLVEETGSVFCWSGNTPAVTADFRSTEVSDVRSISEGCAARQDGSVVCWPVADIGRYGLPGYYGPATVVAGLADTRIVTGNDEMGCAVDESDVVRCWGDNTYGQLGDGSTTSSATPVPADGMTSVNVVATSGTHTCALLDDGTVSCWGRNHVGQLGVGDLAGRDEPTPVPGLVDVTAISVGRLVSCALISDGTVSCWGFGPYTGTGRTTTVQSPTAVTGVDDAAAVGMGDASGCVIVGSGTVRCWGVGFPESLFWNETVFEPTEIDDVRTAVALYVGERACAIEAAGTARCWGLHDSTDGASVFPVVDNRLRECAYFPALSRQCDPIAIDYVPYT